MELVRRFSVNDIPKDEEDEISTIVSRYLLFAHSINLDASETLRRLTEIFLSEAMQEELKAVGQVGRS